MTASDAMLNSIQLHDLIDKVEITEDEIHLMHTLVEKQRDILEKIWFTILDIDNFIKTTKEKYGDDDSYVKIMRCIRDEFAKTIQEPNRFKN